MPTSWEKFSTEGRFSKGEVVGKPSTLCSLPPPLACRPSPPQGGEIRLSSAPRPITNIAGAFPRKSQHERRRRRDQSPSLWGRWPAGQRGGRRIARPAKGLLARARPNLSSSPKAKRGGACPGPFDWIKLRPPRNRKGQVRQTWPLRNQGKNPRASLPAPRADRRTGPSPRENPSFRGLRGPRRSSGGRWRCSGSYRRRCPRRSRSLP